MSQNKTLKKQLDKLRRNRRLLWLAILSFAIVFFWIVLSLSSSQNVLQIDAESKKMALQLIPRLETKTFDDLESKRIFYEEELYRFPIFTLNLERGGQVTVIDIEELRNNSVAEEGQQGQAGEAVEVDQTNEEITPNQSGENQNLEPSPSLDATPGPSPNQVE